MSNVVEDSRTVGRHAWLKQRAEVKQEDIFKVLTESFNSDKLITS